MTATQEKAFCVIHDVKTNCVTNIWLLIKLYSLYWRLSTEMYLWSYLKYAVFAPLLQVDILDLNQNHWNSNVSYWRRVMIVWEEPCGTLSACKVCKKIQSSCVACHMDIIPYFIINTIGFTYFYLHCSLSIGHQTLLYITAEKYLVRTWILYLKNAKFICITAYNSFILTEYNFSFGQTIETSLSSSAKIVLYNYWYFSWDCGTQHRMSLFILFT
jgi:hypothetical protein